MFISSKLGSKLGIGLQAKLPTAGVTPFIDPVGMRLGMNMAGPNSWSGAWLFSNVMFQAAPPDQVTGIGPWTYDRGRITASVPTDVFRIKLADNRTKLPEGVYTIFNPDNLQIACGQYGPPATGWTTASETTYNLVHALGGTFCIYVRGSLTNNNGNLAVIMPGQVAAWKSGVVWNKELLDYYAGIKVPAVRAMDWSDASNTIESNWDDRRLPTDVMFYSEFAQAPVIPYELIFDFAKRVGANPWVCLPARATSDYITKFAQLAKRLTPKKHSLWLEYSNEIWNSGDPWIEGGRWVEYWDFTRYLATANAGPQNFTLANHGLVSGQEIRNFATVENRIKRQTIAQGWRYRLGTALYVKVLDANTFKCYENSDLTINYPVHSSMVNLLYVKTAEPSKVADMHGQYSKRCLQIWDICDSVIGVKNYKRLLVGQSANQNVLNSRLAIPTVRARATAISTAPYYYGKWFGAEVVASSAQVLPKIWVSENVTVHVALYPDTAFPTEAEILSGAGAVNKQTITYTTSNSYTPITAITGLVNDQTYKLFMLVVDTDVNWIISNTVTPSAGGQTIYLEPSFDLMSRINQLDIIRVMDQVRLNIALAPELPLFCYEGGLHFHHAKPAKMKTWLSSYQNSPQFGKVTERYIAELTLAGAKNICYFSDVSDSSFSTAEKYSDLTDPRYMTLAAMKGGVKLASYGAGGSFQNVLADTMATEALYPRNVHTLPGYENYTYEILSGDVNGNFTFVGNVLMMVNGKNVNWLIPAAQTLKILASNGFISKTFDISIGLGNSWYEPDALFAWSTLEDTDSAQINPVIGGTLPLVEGAAPVPTGGMFPMTGARYGSLNALISTPVNSKALLFALVLDKAAHSSNYKRIATLFGPNFISVYVRNGVDVDFGSNVYNGVNANLKFSASTPTGKHVYWTYYDPDNTTITVGIDQTTGNQITFSFAGKTFDKQLFVGGSSNVGMQSSMKHGSMQIINRANMSLANALDIVRKMQDHHNIP